MEKPNDDLIRRIRSDMLDSFDEELEMELDDGHSGGLDAPTQADHDARKMYFRELFRLQPPRVPGGRTARTQRPRTHPVVLPALRVAPASRW